MPKGRRARRVIRKIDTWSVLRLSLLFYLALLLTLLVAGVILWQVAATVGITDNLIKLIKKLGDFSSYKINGRVILKDAALAGLILAFFGAFLNALVCVLYNLISDVVGGIRLEMFDEEVPARRKGTTKRAAARLATTATVEPGDGTGIAAASAIPVEAGAAGESNGSTGESNGSGPPGNGSAAGGRGRPSRRERAQAPAP